MTATTVTLDPLDAAKTISRRYESYLRDTFMPQREDLAGELIGALRNKTLTKGPYLEASAPFENGAPIAGLVAEGVLSELFGRFGDELPEDRPLYVHQEQAIRKAVVDRRNLVVSTGTGSGKTETFLVPIINDLFREIEEGTVERPGVRALLLYPMNALVNDQVKRLRRLLSPAPEIRFGRYVGETQEKASKAEEDFRARYPNEPRIENEMISREEMRDRPPHILITNYAMLEYLLLRPQDSPFFDGPGAELWRALVLDEAHVYSGAQGAEVGMLLRRLRDRVLRSERGRIQCFATSATLGKGEEDYPDLVRFASTLFDETFDWEADDPERQDIVVAERRPLAVGDGSLTLDVETIRELRQRFRAGAGVAELAAIAGDGTAPQPTDSPQVFLATLLRNETHVLAVQRILEDDGGVELDDVARRVFPDYGDASEALVDLIDLAIAARHDSADAPLIPARYHFWVGSLEGGFLCLHRGHPEGHPRLLLARHDSCPACEKAGLSSAMAELGVCRRCGIEYLVGSIRDRGNGDRLELVSDRSTSHDYLLLADSVADVDDDSIAGLEGDLESATATYFDPPTGSVTTEAGEGRIRVQHIGVPERGQQLHRCAACSSWTSNEIVMRLLTGTDAPVSVVATALYQATPPSSDRRQQAEIGEGRKLLVFADSRQDAAYFAPYLERTYGRSTARRLIADAIEEMTDDHGAPRVPDVIDHVYQAAEKALVLDRDDGRTNNRRVAAEWVVQELIAIDRRQSLDGLGLADITVAFPRRFESSPTLDALGLDRDEGAELLRALFETIRQATAITMPSQVDIRDERFAPRNRQIGLREQGAEYGVIGWVPSGSSVNSRTDLLRKIFAARRIDADPVDVLQRLWRDELTTPTGLWSNVLLSENDSKTGTTWRLDHERIELVARRADHIPRRCGTCMRIWWHSVSDVCPGWRCDGTLGPEDGAALDSNHYAQLYRSIQPIGMAVQEHTAQWATQKASQIQDDFVDGRLNILSCSTTFELGVDVGEVQAVLLRNVPPQASNYVQRAGRAGRRIDSAALVVTYAQRRSHDRKHFDDPTPMIEGTIDPPVIIIDNEPIVRRHIHSVAFAAFERAVVDSGRPAHHNVGEFFLTGDEGATPADIEFVEWLGTQPEALGDAIERITPATIADRIGVRSWDWVGALAEEHEDEPAFGWLGRTQHEVREEIGHLEELIENAFAEKNERPINALRRLHNTLTGRQLLGFLSSRNILPKYGFPVDVVELDLRRTGSSVAANLELQRDLRLAIGTYAPGAEVVAGKHTWRSIGLKTRPGHALPRYSWRECKECGGFRSSLHEVEPACPHCGGTDASDGGRYVHPLYGFVGTEKGETGESRPLRSSMIDTWFGAYGADVPDFTELDGLGRALVRYRASRQGRIVAINRGPGRRPFRICSRCGHGDVAPQGKRAKPKPHNDPRFPGRECDGQLTPVGIGHEFLTDVAEIQFGGINKRLWSANAMRSLLYAVLAGAARRGISARDVDGTLHIYSRSEPPALILYDAVPGGAGYARFLLEDLEALFTEALAVAESCECAENESCYGCLRTYSNQLFHDELARGDAILLLREILGEAADHGSDDLDMFSPLVRPLLAAVISSGAEMPIAGYEVEDPDSSGWMLEAAWPTPRIAITLERDEQRDRWLSANGWDVRHVHDWTPPSLQAAL
ncbi:MAG: DEAD/DEAH box helicase [Acidimicrobiales bacterium]